MTISLPDVNILLALVAAGHTHHGSARDWFEGKEDDSVAICRVTQMGLLRLLTNPKVLPAESFSIHRAWEIWNQMLRDRRVFFEYEPTEIETAWAAMMKHPDARVSSWTQPLLNNAITRW